MEEMIGSYGPQKEAHVKIVSGTLYMDSGVEADKASYDSLQLTKLRVE
jgi:hypothetical protein